MLLTQILALLTLKAKIIEMLLEGMTPEQRAAIATQVFEVLRKIDDALDKVSGLFHAEQADKAGKADKADLPPA